MLDHIPMDTEVLRKWLGYVEKETWFPSQAGTPQGGIASPALANMTLDGLATLLNQRFLRKQVDGVRTCPKVHLARYADDFIITGSTKELLETEVRPLVEQFLSERGLLLSPEKTRITHISQGFDFLGQHLRSFDGKLIVQPSKKNTERFLEKIRTLVKANLAVNQAALIVLLNPVIRGWANYHRHVSAKDTFARVDHEIWQALWHWARRRHPKKGARWVKEKYFHSIGSATWVFAVETDKCTQSGKPVWLRLVRASDIPIRRFVKIRAEANPFDPEWYGYFEVRSALKNRRHAAENTPS